MRETSSKLKRAALTLNLLDRIVFKLILLILLLLAGAKLVRQEALALFSQPHELSGTSSSSSPTTNGQ